MKILYVAKKYDYGRPELGLSFAHYNFYDTLTKMNQGENQVIYFAIDELMRQKKDAEEINEDLLKVIDQEEPNLLFFFSGGPIKKETIGEITKNNKTLTFWWVTDDNWIFEKTSKYWAPYFNWIATCDPQTPAKYAKIGYKNVIKTQYACNHFLYQPLNLPKIYDVSFVGHPHGNRKKIIKKIETAGINVKCWGSGWPSGRVSQEDMIKIFSQSKINLNFTKSSGVLWKELALLFLHRDYDRSIKINTPRRFLDSLKSFPETMWNNQIKGRNFEIPGCGSFLLTEEADGLEDYYQIGKEIVCFKDIKDCIEKIKYYLTHEEEREAIAKAGYTRTLHDHTYEKRFNKIFKIIGLIK
jgi:spore maturation protein CgeB